jgi:glycosyltransferase involved in cell wall biosynthesis
VREIDERIDQVIFKSNKLIADGTIFQSRWAREKFYQRGLKVNNFETVILNAPNPTLFHPSSENKKSSKKIRIIATSWSANPDKGFDIYRFLDNNLDFARYEMTFVGRSELAFQNIKHIPPKTSKELGDILREHDIFITASTIDSCPNSLIEAMHCGLPAVARDKGGHPEIVGKSGVVFKGDKDVLAAIDTVARNILGYKEAINLPNMSETAAAYYDFCENIYKQSQEKKYQAKKLNLRDYLNLRINIYRVRNLR